MQKKLSIFLAAILLLTFVPFSALASEVKPQSTDGDILAVVSLIDAIGTVEYTPSCLARITAARAAFDALNYAQQLQVGLARQTLEAAEEAYRRLEGLFSELSALTVPDAMLTTYETLTGWQSRIGELHGDRSAFETVLAEKWAEFDEILAESIEGGVRYLTGFLATLDEDDYTPAQWAQIQALYEQTVASLRAARVEDGISQEVLNAIEAIRAVGTEEGEITVSFRLIGDSEHDNGVYDHVHYVTWLPTKSYTVPVGSTVKTVFELALTEGKLQWRNPGGNYVEAIWAPEVLGGYELAEFTNGRNSGWMYTVNTDHPGVGLAARVLHDGDTVIWHYVDDYTLEADAEFNEADPQYVDRWLEAEDIPPEEYLGLDEPYEGYADVPEDAWYYEDVKYVTQQGLFTGVGGGLFEPDATMTRAMLATVLYRMEGEPPAEGENTFSDVAENGWYTDAVLWAAQAGLVQGYGNGRFGTGDPITREQLAVLLYRYAAYKGEDVSAQAELTFTDAGDVAAWAETALRWAVAEKLINGMNGGVLAPHGSASRAQVAAILQRVTLNVAA